MVCKLQLPGLIAFCCCQRICPGTAGAAGRHAAALSEFRTALAIREKVLGPEHPHTAACLNNLGPGLYAVGLNYAGLEDPAKWILCFAMLLGRLEIFTLLVLISPAFWRH